MDPLLDTAKRLFSEGTDALIKGKLDLAEAKLTECLNLAPDRESIRCNLAVVYAAKADYLVDKGLFNDALIYYDKSLELNTSYALALSNKGTLLKDHFKLIDESIACFRKAIELDLEFADAYQNMGAAYAEKENYQEAIAYYEKALKHNPDFIEAWINRGSAFNKLEKYDVALTCFDRGVELNSKSPEAWAYRSNALNALKRYEEALASYDKAIALKPDYAEAWSDRGNTLKSLERYDEALTSYERAIELKPDYAEAWNNRGNVLNDLRRHEEAITSYEEAIVLRPAYAEAWSNRGVALRDLKHYDKALTSYDRCIKLKHDYAEAWSNRGNVLSDLKRYAEALASYERSIELKPDYAEAWSNRGNVLSDLKRYAEALASYERSIELKPDIDFMLGAIVHTQMKICDWTDLEQRCRTVEKKLLASSKVSTPFAVLGLLDNPELQKRCAEIYAQDKLNLKSAHGVVTQRPKRGKIHIGYFSTDFKEHPVSYLIAELFELHDRSKFEIHGFSFGPNIRDAMRQRVEKSLDNFLDVKHLSDLDIARLSREREIDIAIDLGGHTQDSRPQLFAERVAPIQINYLGYPGTWGSDCMDYFIGDKVTISDKNLGQFSEKIIFLPNSFLVNPSHRPIASKKSSRQDHGLPSGSFVFCCFNNSWKITPKVFEQWMKMLQKVSNSVLWLSEINALAKKNIQRNFEQNGLNISRLIFAKRLPNLADHLARYQLADLFLDTSPYGAHTTASDALWAGVPVLTLKGQSFAARVAASLLTNIGVPELITHTIEEYFSLAVELANNPNKLAAIKAKLAQNRLTTPLFNTELFARHIESAYQAAYDQYHAGLSPDHIYIDS